MSLKTYRQKRNFKKTTEPQAVKAHSAQPIFVVQKHWASHLHYDFRLEAFGVLKSWAVPKGPSTNVGEKRLAVEVEDHPLAYATFEGTIPKGEYGAGTVKIWDHGYWVPPQNLRQALAKGRIDIELVGKKLKGKWLLQKTRSTSGSKNQWLLIKRHDTKSPTSKIELPNQTKTPDPFPTDIPPQLATKVPSGDRFVHEIKLDGYRTLTFIKGKAVQMKTRNGLDWTSKYDCIQLDLKKLGLISAILDGEIVAHNEEGHSDFSALQEALEQKESEQLFYYIFDLLYLNGQDLRELPLEQRKLFLKKLFTRSKSPRLLFNSHVRGQGQELFDEAKKKGLEGIVSKDRLSPYQSRRSPAWQKIKTSKRQEFVIGGFTDPKGANEHFGALLMGVYDDDQLRYVGRVGTGFNSHNLPALLKGMKAIEAEVSPFDLHGPKNSRSIHWVKPALVAEIEFKAWTSDEVLRHASFKGLRSDKEATSVTKEAPLLNTAPSQKQARANASTGSFKITHPNRVVYPATGTRKIDVANFYRSVSPWLLPHLRERPLSLVRCPEHAGQECFFQKHISHPSLNSVHETLLKATDGKTQKVNYVDDEVGVLQFVQWGVLELHTWQGTVRSKKPDQIVFDLDPHESIKWNQVVKTAEKLRDLLKRLDLESFIKTTGGKGLHIHVPIEPIYSWEAAKVFSKTVVEQLSVENPNQLTTNVRKNLRQDKIFLDYLRNGFGSTAVASFSLRSKTKPAVAVPVAWQELKKIKSGEEFDIQSTLKRLAHQTLDPWEGYFELQQRVRVLDESAKMSQPRGRSAHPL